MAQIGQKMFTTNRTILSQRELFSIFIYNLKTKPTQSCCCYRPKEFKAEKVILFLFLNQHRIE